MSNESNQFAEFLKTISNKELQDELKLAKKAMHKHDVFSEHYKVATEEIDIINAEINNRK